MAERVKNPENLDKEKVQAAVEQFGQEKVQETLRKRGMIEDTSAPKPVEEITQTEDIKTEEPTQFEWVEGFKEWQVGIPGVNVKEVTEPTPTETPTQTETSTETPTPTETPTQTEDKKPDQIRIPWVTEPKQDWKETEVVKSEQEQVAEQKNYTYTKDEKWKVVFDPQNLDEALTLFTDFGQDVNIDPSNKLYSTAKKIRQAFSKYQNAPVETYVQWFKNWDIWLSWPTWDMLVKMNGWQPTPEMTLAVAEFEWSLKLTNAQNTTSYISGEPTDTQVDINWKTLSDLDDSYIKKVNQLFWDITADYKEYKEWNEELGELNEELNALSEDIDELNTEKRRVLDNVKERHPNLPLSAQLAIADKELDAIDDQIFVKQREYNSTLSTYKFKSEEAQGDFEFNQWIIESKMNLLSQMYGIKRGDVIRQQDIERQDKLLADSITRADFEYNRALKDGNTQKARDIAYQKEIMKYQAELSKEIKQFQAFNLWDWVVASFDPSTWEIKYSTAPWATTFWESPVELTWNLVPVEFTTPKWNKKNLMVDQAAQESLESLIKQFQIEVPGWDQILIWDSFRTREQQKEYHDAYLAWEGWLAAAPWTSLHEQGLAIDIYSWKDPETWELLPLTNEQVRVMNENGWFQTAWETDLWHFVYRGVWGDEGWDSDIDVIYNQVKAQIPSKQKDSDQEKADIREFTEKMVEQWLDVYEIADIYQWFKVDQYNEFWIKVRDLVASTWSKDDMADLWRLINKWNNEQALRMLYLNANERARKIFWEDSVSESFTRVADSQVNKVLNFMNEKWMEDGIWVVEWTFEQWIWSKFRGEDIQQILTDVLDITATLSTELSWTAKTEAELKFIADLLPSVWDSPANFFVKLNNLKNFPLAKYNSQMTQFGLPELDSNSLQNYNTRVTAFTTPTTWWITTVPKNKVLELVQSAQEKWLDPSLVLNRLIERWYTLEWYNQ